MRYQHHSRGTSNHLLLSHLLGSIINHVISLIVLCVFLLLSKTECLIVAVRRYKRVASIRGKLFCLKHAMKNGFKILKGKFSKIEKFSGLCFFSFINARKLHRATQ